MLLLAGGIPLPIPLTGPRALRGRPGALIWSDQSGQAPGPVPIVRYEEQSWCGIGAAGSARGVGGAGRARPGPCQRMIRDRIREGRAIIDIRPDFARRAAGRAPSPFYGMERRLTSGYSEYSRVFGRTAKGEGGVPGLDF